MPLKGLININRQRNDLRKVWYLIFYQVHIVLQYQYLVRVNKKRRSLTGNEAIYNKDI
jgi:hypothetical protein